LNNIFIDFIKQNIQSYHTSHSDAELNSLPLLPSSEDISRIEAKYNDSMKKVNSSKEVPHIAGLPTPQHQYLSQTPLEIFG